MRGSRWALWLVVGALLGAGTLGVALHSGGDATGTATPGSTTRPDQSPATFDAVPRPGQALVAGTVATLTSDNAEAAALPLPLTLTLPNRGRGGATFRGVQVGGQTVEISWYGGQPLPVSGTGSLDLAGAAVSVDGSGATWMLDGAPRTLTSGRYFLGAPVAVGASGLGTPMDSVTCEAGPASAVETSGGATVHLGVQRLHLEGPGRLSLHGALALRTQRATRTVADIQFGPGDYAIDLTPVPGGYHLTGILQGRVTNAA